MSRRPLSLALALALSAFGGTAAATDLLETYELARSGDPTLAIAESSTFSQKEGAVQARAALLPQISGSASFNRDYNAGDDAIGDPRYSGRAYRASLSQSVFDWGRINNLRSQRALSEAADYDLEASNQDLITRTSAAYFTVLTAIESLAAAQTNERALQKQYDYAQKRLDVGLAPITDVHEARAQYDNARANTILVRNSLDDSYRALAELTGQPLHDLQALPDDFRPELPAGGDAESWVGQALENNPSLRASDLEVRSAEHNVSAARAGHLPSLSLGADYGNSSSWNDQHQYLGLSDRSEGYGYGLTLSVPIFAGGATQSGVRQALASRDIAQDRLEATKRALVRNTSSAYQALVAGVSEVEARRLAVVSAQSALEASQVGLEVGTRTVLDVLQNQRTLFNAQLDYAQSKYNFLQNRLLLEQAAGTLDIDDVRDINRLLTVSADARLESGSM
ncbi:hypothetical protein CSC70_00700 [Pseudoxanthomonas kalamensis DSM 18571]|uniref:TolC family outer membrane protein n=1 Tax=Pseudoxanthomonas kalamensis TaxID=289483 RepID=UPI0013911F0D|nr:TolC family outer membrane protein [Pseudoxanthomonas kalamensis]KAF1712084.1 hypothetical protein CSC70_00700 [Pseudoxanthomonas kalamensis DSM 18571]